MAFKIRKLSNFNSIGKLFKELVNEFFSGQGALTAAAASNQAGGVALSKTVNRFTVVATAGDSATLPAAVVGLVRVVKNADTTDSMDVFPAVGESINALSNDAAYALAATKCVMFVCGTAGKWDTLLTA